MENQDLSFAKISGKETKVRVISETLIAQGSFGDIFDTVVEIGKHRKNFIVKKYSRPSRFVQKDAEESEKDTQRAFKKYAIARKEGLKVFPTFRIGEDKKSILMTTGFSSDKICVGTNTFVSVTDFERPFVKEITNLDQFLTDFFAEGVKAAQKHISFYFDIFFFLLSRKEPSQIDFVIGDFDNLGWDRGINIRNQNLKQIKLALEDFCERNIDPSYRKFFLEKVEFYYQKAISNDKK